jgi:solute carrier family 25 carnitine/acylcarnitine transporter 20/29
MGLSDSAFVDVFAGSVAGILQAIVGHPMDLVKTRMQSHNSGYANSFDCAKRVLAEEGAQGFLKGVSSPVAFSGAMNAVLFSVNTSSRHIVGSLAYRGNVDKLPTTGVILSAWLTAPIYSLVVTPMEVIKCRLQIQQGIGGRSKYAGLIDCAIKIWKQEGAAG